MASIPGTVLASKISPGDDSATFPTHVDIYGQGGWMSFTDRDALTALPTDRQKLHMRLVDQSTGIVYALTATGADMGNQIQKIMTINSSGVAVEGLSFGSTVTDGFGTVLSMSAVGKPEWHGAVGDGITNDQEAIETALATYDVVLFDAKTYVVSGQVSIPSGTTLRGQGIDKTIIKMMDNSMEDDGDLMISVFYSSGKRDITVEHMTIDGNFNNQLKNHNGRAMKTIQALTFPTAFQININNVKATGFGTGAPMLSGTDSETLAADVRECFPIWLQAAQFTLGNFSDAVSGHLVVENCIVSNDTVDITKMTEGTEVSPITLSDNYHGNPLTNGSFTTHAVIRNCAVYNVLGDDKMWITRTRRDTHPTGSYDTWYQEGIHILPADTSDTELSAALDYANITNYWGKINHNLDLTQVVGITGAEALATGAVSGLSATTLVLEANICTSTGVILSAAHEFRDIPVLAFYRADTSLGGSNERLILSAGSSFYSAASAGSSLSGTCAKYDSTIASALGVARNQYARAFSNTMWSASGHILYNSVWPHSVHCYTGGSQVHDNYGRGEAGWYNDSWQTRAHVRDNYFHFTRVGVHCVQDYDTGHGIMRDLVIQNNYIHVQPVQTYDAFGHQGIAFTTTSTSGEPPISGALITDNYVTFISANGHYPPGHPRMIGLGMKYYTFRDAIINDNYFRMCGNNPTYNTYLGQAAITVETPTGTTDYARYLHDNYNVTFRGNRTHQGPATIVNTLETASTTRHSTGDIYEDVVIVRSDIPASANGRDDNALTVIGNISAVSNTVAISGHTSLDRSASTSDYSPALYVQQLQTHTTQITAPVAGFAKLFTDTTTGLQTVVTLSGRWNSAAPAGPSIDFRNLNPTQNTYDLGRIGFLDNTSGYGAAFIVATSPRGAGPTQPVNHFIIDEQGYHGINHDSGDYLPATLSLVGSSYAMHTRTITESGIPDYWFNADHTTTSQLVSTAVIGAFKNFYPGVSGYQTVLALTGRWTSVIPSGPSIDYYIYNPSGAAESAFPAGRIACVDNTADWGTALEFFTRPRGSGYNDVKRRLQITEAGKVFIGDRGSIHTPSHTFNVMGSSYHESTYTALDGSSQAPGSHFYGNHSTESQLISTPVVGIEKYWSGQTGYQAVLSLSGRFVNAAPSGPAIYFWNRVDGDGVRPNHLGTLACVDDNEAWGGSFHFLTHQTGASTQPVEQVATIRYDGILSARGDIYGGLPFEIGTALTPESGVDATASVTVSAMTLTVPHDVTLESIKLYGTHRSATGTVTVTVLSAYDDPDNAVALTTVSLTGDTLKGKVLRSDTIAEDSYIRFDISTTSGSVKGLKVWILGKRHRSE